MYYIKNRPKVLLYNKKLRRKTTLEKQERLVQYLLNKCCDDCGIKDIRVLQFDHVVGNKKADVTRMVASNYSWETIRQEIKKCEIVCGNCHSIREQVRRNTYRVKLMLKCKNSDKYKALEPPKCGCEACKQKWESINRAKARKLERIRGIK